jgi:manganese/zinc/iron transport system substrate-binding protein
MIRTLPAVALAALVASPAASDEPLRVLATIGMVADVAKDVAGRCAEVEALIGAGSDPHLYRATASDVGRLVAADLVLYVDPALEARLADVLAGMDGRVSTLGLARAAFGLEHLIEDPEAPGQIDPHLWMDAALWGRIAPVVAQAIAAQRPACATELAANAAATQARLAALSGWVSAAMASVPAERRVLVTAHDAFGYFIAAYGLTQANAIEGLSTDSEASIGDIREVAAFVIESGVPAVFPETTISPRTIEALVREVRALGGTVEIGGPLFSDAMGEEGTPEGTYIGMIRHNTVAITGALGGTLPEWPVELADWATTWGIQP